MTDDKSWLFASKPGINWTPRQRIEWQNGKRADVQRRKSDAEFRAEDARNAALGLRLHPTDIDDPWSEMVLTTCPPDCYHRKAAS